MPDNVEQWEPPCEKADLLLLTAHSDDEHLFLQGFCRIMPESLVMQYKLCTSRTTVMNISAPMRCWKDYGWQEYGITGQR